MVTDRENLEKRYVWRKREEKDSNMVKEKEKR